MAKGFTVVTVLGRHRRPHRKRIVRYNHGARWRLSSKSTKGGDIVVGASRSVGAFARELDREDPKSLEQAMASICLDEGKSSCPWFLPIGVSRARMDFQARAKIHLHQSRLPVTERTTNIQVRILSRRTAHHFLRDTQGCNASMELSSDFLKKFCLS